MPYCPKCDMDFVEGITACSDCGQPLISAEEALQMKEQEKKQKEEEYILKLQNDLARSPLQAPESNKKEEEAPAEPKAENRTYIPKRQRYEDMKSSISAFFLMGGIFLAFGVLCLVNLIELPLAAGPAILFETVLTALGAGCLIIAAVTKASAGRMIKEADVEDARTKELMTWFTEAYNRKEIDEKLLLEDPSLDENELYLKRFELIQDRLITSHDLPNASYVDYLSEEIYGKVFEKA